VRSNEPIRNLHLRICERNPNTKMKGIIAAMRKLLVLIFVLWKKMSPTILTMSGKHSKHN
ncbi:hypothetical protein EZS27_035637, partial [termite gut metagenome]